MHAAAAPSNLDAAITMRSAPPMANTRVSTHMATEHCNIHAAITMRFATSLGNPHVSMHMATQLWQHSCSHSTAICNQRFNKRIELCRHEQPQSAEHSGGNQSHAKATPAAPASHGMLPFIAGVRPLYPKKTQCFALRLPPKNMSSPTFCRHFPKSCTSLYGVPLSLSHHFSNVTIIRKSLPV